MAIREEELNLGNGSYIIALINDHTKDMIVTALRKTIISGRRFLIR